MTNTKPSNRFIKVGNRELCDVKDKQEDIVFEQHGTGLKLGWHPLVSMGFSKNNISKQWLLAGGYQVVMESEDRPHMTSKKEKRLKNKIVSRKGTSALPSRKKGNKVSVDQCKQMGQ